MKMRRNQRRWKRTEHSERGLCLRHLKPGQQKNSFSWRSKDRKPTYWHLKNSGTSCEVGVVWQAHMSHGCSSSTETLFLNTWTTWRSCKQDAAQAAALETEPWSLSWCLEGLVRSLVSSDTEQGCGAVGAAERSHLGRMTRLLWEEADVIGRDSCSMNLQGGYINQELPGLTTSKQEQSSSSPDTFTLKLLIWFVPSTSSSISSRHRHIMETWLTDDVLMLRWFFDDVEVWSRLPWTSSPVFYILGLFPLAKLWQCYCIFSFFNHNQRNMNLGHWGLCFDINSCLTWPNHDRAEWRHWMLMQNIVLEKLKVWFLNVLMFPKGKHLKSWDQKICPNFYYFYN